MSTTKAKKGTKSSKGKDEVAAKPEKGEKTEKADKAPKKLSALDAAAKVLEEAGSAMITGEMITVMAEKGYWKTPGGKTPAATLYSAILREITTKGKESRFEKTERGKFACRQK